jgi:hypothetical protein
MRLGSDFGPYWGAQQQDSLKKTRKGRFLLTTTQFSPVQVRIQQQVVAFFASIDQSDKKKGMPVAVSSEARTMTLPSSRRSFPCRLQVRIFG